jgi:hypothetical protein
MSFNSKGLLKPQIEHAEFLADAQKRLGKSWDGSHTGTGKTPTACSIIRDSGKPFVVLCPRNAIPTWKHWLKEFGLEAKAILGYEKLVRGSTPWLKYARLKKDKEAIRQILGVQENEMDAYLETVLKFPKDWLVVCDESHRGKGVTSLTAGIFIALKRQGYNCHLMSATQAMTPMDMRAFGYLMDLHNVSMKDFKRFCVDAGAEWVGKWGAQFFDSTNPESVAKLKKVHNYLFNEIRVGHRLTRQDFGDIFPASQIIAEPLDMGSASDKIQGVYDNMEVELAKLEERSANYKEHIFAILMKARMETEILKVPTIVEKAVELYEEGMSPVIFVNFQDSIDAIVSRLVKATHKDLIAQIHGGIQGRNREQQIADYNSDRKRFMVANMLAGGEFISLHDLIGNFPRASIFNPSYRAIAVLQALGRIDRANAKTPVLQLGMFAARTIEEEVAQNFNRKKDHIDILNDGDLVPKRIFEVTHRTAMGMNV